MPKKSTSGQKKAQNIMKKAAQMYWDHKEKHPESRKKITEFVRELWRGK